MWEPRRLTTPWVSTFVYFGRVATRLILSACNLQSPFCRPKIWDQCRMSHQVLKFASYYCYWGGTKSLVLRPLLAYCTKLFLFIPLIFECSRPVWRGQECVHLLLGIPTPLYLPWLCKYAKATLRLSFFHSLYSTAFQMNEHDSFFSIV
jgi:hypothetical protein